MESNSRLSCFKPEELPVSIWEEEVTFTMNHANEAQGNQNQNLLKLL